MKLFREARSEATKHTEKGWTQPPKKFLAQTAVEYLILVSIVIVIALIILWAAGGLPFFSRTLAVQDSTAYWERAEIGITNFWASPRNTSFVIKNNKIFDIKNIRVILGNVSSTEPKMRLMPRQTANFSSSAVCSRAGEPVSLKVEITYEDANTNRVYAFKGEKRLLAECQG